MFASNVFSSDVTGRFDMIISNPPFHDGMETNSEAAQNADPVAQPVTSTAAVSCVS